MPTVRLTWTDLNSGAAQEDEIRVYRAEAAFDEGTLPAILATLDPDVTTYDDETAEDASSYFYAVAMVKDGQLALSFTAEVTIGITAGAIEYFHATNSATQTLPTSVTEEEIDFGTEVNDSFEVFASHRFTVPAAMDGFYALLNANIVVTPTRFQTNYFYIERSRDAGTSWTKIGGGSNGEDGSSSITLWTLLAEGDIYRVLWVGNTLSADVADDDRVRFGAIILEPIP